MLEMARRLKISDKKIQEQCTVGKFGRDLEDRLRTLSEAIMDVRRRVEGDVQPYTGKEAVAGAFFRYKNVFRGGLGILVRIIGLTLILLLIGFSYLFITMERTGGIEKEIDQAQAQIQVLEKELAEIQDEMRPVEKEMKSLEGKTYKRQSKVRWMELRVELKKIEEEAQAVEGNLALKQIELKDAKERLKDIENRSFIERLFRIEDEKN
jgi:hypothetical protein